MDSQEGCDESGLCGGLDAGEKSSNAAKGFESRFLRFEGGVRMEVVTTVMLSPVTVEVGAQRIGWTHLAFAAGPEERVEELTGRRGEEGFAVVDGGRGGLGLLRQGFGGWRTGATRTSCRIRMRTGWRSWHSDGRAGLGVTRVPSRISCPRLTAGSFTAGLLAHQRPPAGSAYRFEDFIAQGGAAFIELLFGVADRVCHVGDQADREIARRAECE